MKTLTQLLCGAAIGAVTMSASQAALVMAAYDFNNSLAAVAGVGPGANALVAVDPMSSSGFVADSVNGVSRTVWRFAGSASPATNQGGLQFTSANLMTPTSYTVELYFRFDEVSSWRRILDTADRSSDVGFYVLNGGLQLYPSNVGVGTFNANTYYHVLLSYSGTQANAYLNGALQSSQTTSYYDLPASNIISLFLDNTQSVAQNEYSPGAIAWARFYDGMMTDAEARAAYNSALVFNPAPGASAPVPGSSPIPEPGALALTALALGLAAAASRRRAS